MDHEPTTLLDSKRVDAYFFKQKLALVFICCFSLGVFVASFVFISPLVSVLMLIVAGAVFLVEKVWHRQVQRETLVIVFIIISFSLGSLRYAVKDFHTLNPVLVAQVGEEVLLEGLVVGEPEAKDASTSFILEAGEEKILVTADLYTSLQYGDVVRVKGKLGRPSIIDDGSGRPFDYQAYLAKDDIYFTMSFAEAEVVSSGHGNPLKQTLFSIKRSFVSQAKEIFSEPHASLLAGLIVAGKDAMPKDVLEEFRRAGVVHIVVLSGYNITIIAEFMRKMFENIFLLTKAGARPQLAAGASILGIIFFVLMTGAEATVVRASIMVLVVIAAKLFGRAYSAPRALLCAAFLMVLHNPKILVFDPSFQLSFLATCGLIYVSPIVEKYLSKVPSAWGTRSMLATTIATQATVLPFLIYAMGDVSLVSLPANVLVLLFIPLTMLFGFVAATASYISMWLAVPFAYVAHIFLSWILGVSSVLGNLSFASVSVPLFPVWLLVLSYLVIITFVRRSGSSPPRSASLGF